MKILQNFDTATKSVLIAGVLGLAALFGVYPLLTPPVAQAQPYPIQPRRLAGLSNALGSLMLGTNTAYTLASNSYPQDISAASELGVGIKFLGISTTTTNWIGLRFGLSGDGTNYSSTNNALTFLFTPEGAATVYPFSNFPRSCWAAARKIKLLDVTNNNLCASGSNQLYEVWYYIKQ